MCLVDLKKAFDCVPRGILWEVLWEYGVGGPLLRAVQSLYDLDGGSGICFRCPHNASLGRCSWHVPPEGDPEEEPGHTRSHYVKMTMTKTIVVHGDLNKYFNLITGLEILTVRLLLVVRLE